MNQGICILLAFLHEVPFDLLAPLFLVWSEPLIDHALKPRHVTNEAHRFGYHLAINFSAPRASVQNDRPDPRKAFNENSSDRFEIETRLPHRQKSPATFRLLEGLQGTPRPGCS